MEVIESCIRDRVRCARCICKVCISFNLCHESVGNCGSASRQDFGQILCREKLLQRCFASLRANSLDSSLYLPRDYTRQLENAVRRQQFSAHCEACSRQHQGSHSQSRGIREQARCPHPPTQRSGVAMHACHIVNACFLFLHTEGVHARVSCNEAVPSHHHAGVQVPEGTGPAEASVAAELWRREGG